MKRFVQILTMQTGGEAVSYQTSFFFNLNQAVILNNSQNVVDTTCKRHKVDKPVENLKIGLK